MYNRSTIGRLANYSVIPAQTFITIRDPAETRFSEITIEKASTGARMHTKGTIKGGTIRTATTRNTRNCWCWYTSLIHVLAFVHATWQTLGINLMKK